MLWVALISLIFIRVIYSSFEGVVAAKLPFEPFAMISGLTHYGLGGDDMHDCSMTFIYVLMNLTIGNYLKKSLKLEGKRVQLPQATPWG